jgi:hypothetical protein
MMSWPSIVAVAVSSADRDTEEVGRARARAYARCSLPRARSIRAS